MIAKGNPWHRALNIRSWRRGEKNSRRELLLSFHFRRFSKATGSQFRVVVKAPG